VGPLGRKHRPSVGWPRFPLASHHRGWKYRDHRFRVEWRAPARGGLLSRLAASSCGQPDRGRAGPGVLRGASGKKAVPPRSAGNAPRGLFSGANGKRAHRPDLRLVKKNGSGGRKEKPRPFRLVFRLIRPFQRAQLNRVEGAGHKVPSVRAGRAARRRTHPKSKVPPRTGPSFLRNAGQAAGMLAKKTSGPGPWR